MSDQTDNQKEKQPETTKPELPPDILEEVNNLQKKVGNLEKIMDQVITNVKNN